MTGIDGRQIIQYAVFVHYKRQLRVQNISLLVFQYHYDFES